MGRVTVNIISWSLSDSGLSGFVSGSAGFLFPGIHVIRLNWWVSKPWRMRLTSERIDLSVAFRQFYSDSYRSFESISITKSNLMPRSSSKLWTKIFPSSMPGPAANVSADPIYFNGRFDFWEHQFSKWNVDPWLISPNRRPAIYPSCPFSLILPASENTMTRCSNVPLELGRWYSIVEPSCLSRLNIVLCATMSRTRGSALCWR